MLERFKAGYEHLLGLEPVPGVDSPTDPATEAQHRAVLELLVATMFSDGTVSATELEEIDAFSGEHQWDTPTFSFSQALGSATSTVRNARDREDGIDALLAQASSVITEPELRATVAAACRLVASADGTTDDAESAWIAAVERTFGG
ncbi:TerB family tellurite resistance protein [Aquihabitans sp. McL0605]|uniref:TerB family tellurite resistance protein n=1 Tax=Aquihabitans sp. McL0605 TaxID=3415671 RepID=UPI003CF90209